MALIFMEGFDDGLMQVKGWSPYGGSYPSTVAGRYGGKAIQTAYYQVSVKRGYPQATGTVIAGMALQPSSTSTSFSLVTHGMARLQLMAGGALGLYRSDNSTQIAVSPNIVWNGAVWHYIELKYTPTTGACEVRVDGIVCISGTVPTTTSVSILTFEPPLSGFNYLIDDVYLLDTTGTTNNNYLGDVRVQTLLPASDGSNLGMTPSSGTTHYNLVNEATPDTTTYVSSSSAGVKDSYHYQSLTANTASVFGVAVTSYASKDAPASAGIASVVRLSGTDYVNGSPQQLSASWSGLTDLYQTRPSDGSTWTTTDVNNAEFGIQTS